LVATGIGECYESHTVEITRITWTLFKASGGGGCGAVKFIISTVAAPPSIVECAGIAGFEIHKTGNPIWVCICHPTQFCAGQRMSHQDRFI